MAKRTYTQEEVDAILDRAIKEQSAEAGKLTHEELVSAAAEVGIPKAAIDDAARDLTEPAKSAESGELSDAQVVRAWRKRRSRALVKHVVVFVLVNMMLAFINFATSTAFLWFPIVFFAWGIGVAMQLLGVLFADDERIVVRERRRLDREARRARWREEG